MEKIIWRTLLELAGPTSTSTAAAALRRIKDDIPWDSLPQLSAAERGWFNLSMATNIQGLSPQPSTLAEGSFPSSASDPLMLNTESLFANISPSAIQQAVENLPPTIRAHFNSRAAELLGQIQPTGPSILSPITLNLGSLSSELLPPPGPITPPGPPPALHPLASQTSNSSERLVHQPPIVQPTLSPLETQHQLTATSPHPPPNPHPP